MPRTVLVGNHEGYCIVTGANAGIGKEVTIGLMAEGAHVVMACRNMEACHVAKAELEQRGLAGSCACSRLDLSDLQSIRLFAQQQQQQLQRQAQPLKILVNNAGVMGVGPGPQGEDQHLIVNHLGPFLLTNLLLPCMTAGSRIVNVSSRASLWGHVAVRDGQITQGSRFWFHQYARSKLCNVLFTAELQRRLQQSRGILATAVSPGFVNTTLFRSFPAPFSWGLQKFVPLVARTPQQGAHVAVFAATSPSLTADQAVPLFLHDCKPQRPPSMAGNSQLAAELWTASAAVVGWKDDKCHVTC